MGLSSESFAVVAWCCAALTPELKEALDKFVAANKIVLFMKGTKLFPQCGFSNTCVQILNLMECPYETVNILEDEQLRQALKEYSAWPTFPQLYIDGEFFGGCDITVGQSRARGRQTPALPLYPDLVPLLCPCFDLLGGDCCIATDQGMEVEVPAPLHWPGAAAGTAACHSWPSLDVPCALCDAQSHFKKASSKRSSRRLC